MGGRLVQVVVTILAVAAGTLAVMALRGEFGDLGGLALGNCVRHAGANRIELVHCSSEGAFGEVIETYAGDNSFAPVNCPAETDTFGTVGRSTTACVRNLEPPHPGDPGQGGGVLRAQDCIRQPLLAVKEVYCDSPDAYGRLAGVAGEAGRCPQEAVQFVQLDSRARKGVCLAPGLKVPGVGTCLSDPSLPFGGRPVDCGSSPAAARVAARVDEAPHCPPGTSSGVKDEVGLPDRDTLCLGPR